MEASTSNVDSFDFVDCTAIKQEVLEDLPEETQKNEATIEPKVELQEMSDAQGTVDDQEAERPILGFAENEGFPEPSTSETLRNDPGPLPNPTELVCVKMEQLSEDECEEERGGKDDSTVGNVSNSGNTSFRTTQALSDNSRPITAKESVTKFHVKRKCECNNCKKSLKRSFVQVKHLKLIHSINPPLKCVTCNKEFQSQLERSQHVQAEHGFCRKCGEWRTEEFDLGKNRNVCNNCRNVTKNPKETFPCPDSSCTSVFNNNVSLRRHVSNTHEEKVYHKCETCGKLYQSATMLKKHMDRGHPQMLSYKCKVLTYKCSKCNKHFTRSDGLARHEKECNK